MSDQRTYKIRHDRPNCIGCQACANVTPDFWTMSPIDGKSDIVGSEMDENGWEELQINEVNFDTNMQAAELCPVNVIHLIHIGDNKQLI